MVKMLDNEFDERFHSLSWLAFGVNLTNTFGVNSTAFIANELFRSAESDTCVYYYLWFGFYVHSIVAIFLTVWYNQKINVENNI